MSAHTQDVIPGILETHASEAASLWAQRNRAALSPHYTLRQLAALDDRLEAHLDGLRIAGEPGWELCRIGLEEGGPGELFVAAVLALEGDSPQRVRQVLELGPTAPPRIHAFASALGWLPYARVQSHIAQLCGPGPLPHRCAGLAAACIHRRLPGVPLYQMLSGEHWFDVRVFRAVGELAARDASIAITRGLRTDDPACRYWAAWSGLLVFNDPASLAALQEMTETDSPLAEEAARLVPRRLSPATAGRWIQSLANARRKPRLAVIAAGAAGDPANVPWLLEQMQSPALARVAGEAFAAMTGVDLARDRLHSQQPEGFTSGPSEDPADDNVAPDLDEHLPWPDVQAIRAWYGSNQGRFTRGTRYLLGSPITAEGCKDVLRRGQQRQRATAAVELALAQPGPLFEVAAIGFRQLHLLGLPLRV